MTRDVKTTKAVKTLPTQSFESVRKPSAAEREWEEKTLAPTLRKTPDRDADFTTVSSYPIRRLYTQADLAGWDAERDLGFPGQPPYTRGIHSTMYRGKLWTMRQFAGFGTAEDTNARFRYLLSQGQTGLSVAFDLPALMGYDSDHPLAEGEVGKCGVAISSLADMEVLFDKIPLADVTTSMTINSPAAVIWAMYLAVAEKQGADWKKISGTLQNDILKEYIAQKEYIYPPEPSMRLVIDTLEFGAKHTPKFNPISISGYHIREAGSTAIQELAFTLARRNRVRGLRRAPRNERRRFCAAAFLLLQRAQRFLRGNREISSCSPHLVQDDARSLRLEERALLGAAFPHADGRLLAHCSAALQQRGADGVAGSRRRDGRHAIAAHEFARRSLGLPTEFAATLALRTQQIIAHESGVTNTADPLGGSYFVEALTDEVERGAWDYIEKIDALGGMVAAIERGFPQREIAEAAYRYQVAVDRKEKIVVGVNDYVAAEKPLEILQIDETVAHRQGDRLRKLRADRSNAEVERRLNALRKAAAGTENLMPYLFEAVKAYATLGEICDTMREAFGVYEEVAIT